MSHLTVLVLMHRMYFSSCLATEANIAFHHACCMPEKVTTELDSPSCMSSQLHLTKGQTFVQWP